MEKLFDIKRHDASVYEIERGIDEQTFFSASGDGKIGLWDLEKQDVLPLSVQAEGAVFSICYLPENENLVIGRFNGSMHVVDLSTKEEIKNIEHHKKGIFSILNFSKEHIITLGGDGVMSIWHKESYQLYRSFPLSGVKLRAAVQYNEGEKLFVACAEGYVHVLETTLFNTLQKNPVDESGLTALALHPQKKILVAGSNDGYIHLLQIKEKGLEFYHKFPAHKGAIYGIQFSPDQRYFATASRDKTIKIWDAQDLSLYDKMEDLKVGHRYSVNTLYWDQKRDILVSGSDDARVIGWKVSRNQE